MELTKEQLIFRKVLEEADEWWYNLEKKYNFTEFEAQMIESIMFKYLNNDTFPSFSEISAPKKYIKHAKKGWEHMKQIHQMYEIFPRSVTNQIRRNGVWKMLKN